MKCRNEPIQLKENCMNGCMGYTGLSYPPIRNTTKRKAIAKIMVTDKKEVSVQGYKVQGKRYSLKPVCEDCLLKIMDYTHNAFFRSLEESYEELKDKKKGWWDR